MKEKTENSANTPGEGLNTQSQPVHTGETGGAGSSHDQDNNDAYTDEYDNYSPWG